MGPTDHIVDSHFHVIAPLARFPMLPARSYTPAPAALADWRATLGSCGVAHGVVVQPSVYGTDNRALLAALAEGQGQLVGIAAVAPDVSDAELDGLVAAGVRGVRMAHVEVGDARTPVGFVAFSAFEALESRLLERGLHLQLLTDSRHLSDIADQLVRSRVPVVIDHMGRAPAALGCRHIGIRLMTELLQNAPVWVKLSGIANVSSMADRYEDARDLHELLLATRPDRLLWGSDWPHTRPAGPIPRTTALLELFRDWTPVPLQAEILRGNAHRLYRLEPLR